MKRIQTTTTTALLMLAGAVLPAFGQSRGFDRGFQRQERPHQERTFPEQRWQGHAQPQPRQAPQQFREQQFHEPQRQSFQPQQNYQRFSEPYRAEPQRFREEGFRGPEYRSNGWNGGYRTWNGGYRGSVPQARFYASFGREHFFRIGRPRFYGGYSWFNYGGFSFRFVDSYPSYWGPNWFDTDDVYIDYDDGGYYLYDNRYPGEGVPVEIDN